MLERWRITAAGVVQGIGFRPFIYRTAAALSLVGFVRNDGDGVVMELEGPPSALRRFDDRLQLELPAGGRLDRVARERCAPLQNEACFQIHHSSADTSPLMSLAPDRAMCAMCAREMADPSDRRYGYPFINCTHCGPRYTITKRLPYDRPMTTMCGFPMCEQCRAEYVDPMDRRYHAQPVACPECGPHVWLARPGGEVDDAPADHWAREAAKALFEDRIVAVKGLGGFHLSVNGASAVAVGRLRGLKRRERKPFALMVRDMPTAERLVRLDAEAKALLASPAAPIVLAPMRDGCDMGAWVAPGLDDLGVMLPYTPLHHQLLVAGPAALVMTSGNPPSEPITTDNTEALRTLGADLYVMHNRDIAVANDDSVVRTGPLGSVLIRRSRGYVPEPIDVSRAPDRSVLALGAVLKVALATIHKGQLVVGRHLGDLDNERSEAAFEEEVERMLSFGRFTPEAVAVDLHPDLPSTAFAQQRFNGIPLFKIQHHHAHLASVMAEHGLLCDAKVAGILLDGFGYGTDGTLWGGEVLEGGFGGVTRRAHLRPVPQPGGDMGAIEPGRMATSLLVDAGIPPHRSDAFDPAVAEVCSMRAVSPMTSSVGRLFDGVSALLGLCPRKQGFEGEAAALVERTADATIQDAYPISETAGVLDTRGLTTALLDDTAPVAVRAARFINAVADGFALAAAATSAERVVLSGGAIVNRLLSRRLVDRLRMHGKTVLLPRRLPAGDGGLSAGQAMIAVHLLEGM